MEAHICTNGKMKPYPSRLCNMCLPNHALDIVVKTQEELEEYNRMIDTRNERKTMYNKNT